MIASHNQTDALAKISRGAQPRDYLHRASFVPVAIDLVLYSLWLGGLIVIGAVVAPVAFAALRHAPELAASLPAQSRIAGAVVGGSLRIYNVLALASGLWLTARAGWLSSERAFAGRLIVIAPAALCLAVTIVQTVVLFPHLDRAQSSGQMTQFDAIHHLYERLSGAQMLLMLLFAAGYAWLLETRASA